MRHIKPNFGYICIKKTRKYKLKDNQKLEYLHKNPVEICFVLFKENELYCSAKQYFSGEKEEDKNIKQPKN